MTVEYHCGQMLNSRNMTEEHHFRNTTPPRVRNGHVYVDVICSCHANTGEIPFEGHVAEIERWARLAVEQHVPRT